MLIVSEVLTILKWEAFWKTHNKSAYNDVVTSLETLQESMCNKEREGTFSNLKEFQKKNNQLKKDFSIFTEECKNISQIFHYFEYFLYMMSLLKQLIATGKMIYRRFKVFYQFSVNLIVSTIFVMGHSI